MNTRKPIYIFRTPVILFIRTKKNFGDRNKNKYFTKKEGYKDKEEKKLRRKDKGQSTIF